MNPKIYIGVDPGKSGGIVVLNADGKLLDILSLRKVPLWRVDEFVKNWYAIGGEDTKAVIEKVGGYLGKEEAATGSRMFEFGWSAGILEMALVSAGLRENLSYKLVPPKEWQRAFGMSKKKKESKSVWKNRLMKKAKTVVNTNGKKLTLGTADAVLMAKYAIIINRKVTD